jgi:hypothetical protein
MSDTLAKDFKNLDKRHQFRLRITRCEALYIALSLKITLETKLKAEAETQSRLKKLEEEVGDLKNNAAKKGGISRFNAFEQKEKELQKARQDWKDQEIYADKCVLPILIRRFEAIGAGNIIRHSGKKTAYFLDEIYEKADIVAIRKGDELKLRGLIDPRQAVYP